jgi:hypothetical protein
VIFVRFFRAPLPTPYVNAFSETPDNGFMQFFDSPRYSTGYTSLFNTIGFVVETHMLKNMLIG